VNDPDIFKNYCKCGVCGKNEATKLCDFVIDYKGVAYYRNSHDFLNQSRYETCDLPLCDKCATNHVGHDFCPHHEHAYHGLMLTDRKQIEAQGKQKMQFLANIRKGD